MQVLFRFLVNICLCKLKIDRYSDIATKDTAIKIKKYSVMRTVKC